MISKVGSLFVGSKGNISIFSLCIIRLKAWRMPSFLICLFMMFVLLIGHPVEASEQAHNEKSLSNPTLVNPSRTYTPAGKAGNGNEETPGEWYAGETPANLRDEAPILLFVPGLNNTAQIFWEENDMYQTAYDAGYQTAFVQLYDAGGESADMWDNGQLLADKISEISDYFAGKKITIVAYSKGGVDSQTAVTYYGAWENVDNIITLSSPHHGSQLADLAYSFWAGWLADLIGMQGEGTYAMETGFMENFRTQIDSQPKAYYNDIFTLGGTDWGTMFSSTWFGGMYLSSYGNNDGVVTTTSSNLPGGHELAIGEWSHTTIRTGQTFDVFQSYLMDNKLLSSRYLKKESQREQSIRSSDQWIHGGPLTAGNIEQIRIPVEESVGTLNLHIMTAENPSTINVIDPTGKEVNMFVQSDKADQEFFVGATSNIITLDQPMAGEWRIELKAKESNAYLLVADYDTKRKLRVTNEAGLNKHRVTANNKIMYLLTADTEAIQEKSLQAIYHVIEADNPGNVKMWSVKGNADLSQELTFDKKNTVYNITVDVEGLTKSGHLFKRTVVDSVFSGR